MGCLQSVDDLEHSELLLRETLGLKTEILTWV